MSLIGLANLAALAVLLRVLLGSGGEPAVVEGHAAGPAGPAEDQLAAPAQSASTPLEDEGPEPEPLRFRPTSSDPTLAAAEERAIQGTPLAATAAALDPAAPSDLSEDADALSVETLPAAPPSPETATDTDAAALPLLEPALAGVSAAPAAASSAGPTPSIRVSPGPAVSRDRALERRLRARIEAKVASASKATEGAVTAANTTVAVCVRRLGRPGTLVALEADRALRPASNMKLVTAAAALVLLGPQARLETRFEADGELRDGVLAGDLVVRAGGDPLFDPRADGRVDHLLAPLVAELRAAGLGRIAGDLVLDEGAFPLPAPGPGWPDPSQYWQEHCALAGGFSANAGCLTAVVEATSTGELARSFVHPLHHGLPRTGTVRTVASPPLDVRVGVQGVSARQVVLDGTVPRSVSRWTSRFAHPDPVELFGRVLVAALEQGGIALEGCVLRERREDGLRPLARLTTPLVDLLGPINTDSNNTVADQVFLALGGQVLGEPTRAGGAQATAKALERLGVASAGLVQVDGSGLSRDGRITARQLAALLDAVLSEPGERAEAFLASLAVGGETGTLSARLREEGVRGRVRAKTGFIGGTSALSGVVETPAGEWLVFSILVEYPRLGGLNNSHWKPLQDELVKELLRE